MATAFFKDRSGNTLSHSCRDARFRIFDLMPVIPFAPIRRLNVDALSIRSIDPLGSIDATREHERVDDSIIVQGADLKVSVRWRN
jgi:hypothetical protein